MSNTVETNVNENGAQYYELPLLLQVLGALWSIHILIAALLFPRFLWPSLELEDPENKRKEKTFAFFRLFFGTLILFFNFSCALMLLTWVILGIIYLLLHRFIPVIEVLGTLYTFPVMIAAAKTFFVLAMWMFIAIIYILVNYFRDLYHLLAILEEEAIQSRDQSVMLIRAGHAALRAGNLKIYGQEKTDDFSFAHLLKKIGPLALLVMKKTDVRTVAVESLKIALSGTVLRFLF
jgi:hypothetical protein